MSRNSATPAAPRGRGRPRDTALRQRILTAAARLAADEGIDVSFERIAHAAGASRTTLYRWWQGPHELLLDALLEATAFSLQHDAGTGTIDQLRGQVESAAAVLLDATTGAPLRALAAAALTREGARIDFWEHWLRPRRAAARELILAGIAEGTIADDDPDALIDVLFAPVYHRAFFTAMPLTDAYVDVLMRRIRP
ncbi:TetR/AcrR family transcriptional regulator C-terminal ligand-binding domain-containing protein [Microbacterium aurum]